MREEKHLELDKKFKPKSKPVFTKMIRADKQRNKNRLRDVDNLKSKANCGKRKQSRQKS